MRVKTVLLLAVAVTCGLVAMLGVQQVLSKPAEGQPEVVKILVAKAEVLPGQPLEDKNVEFKEWPAQFIPEGAIRKAEQIKDRTLKVRAFPGDFITEMKLDKRGSRNASSDVPKGMRVASVPIDPTMTGSGLIYPGDKVDVLVTYKSAGRDLGVGSGIGKEIKTVLECVEVFAIDGQRDRSLAPSATGNSASQIKNVSLLVSHEQAKLLKLADDVGDIHLTLRPNDDDSHVDAEELFDPRQAEVVKIDSEMPEEEEEPQPVVQAPPPEPKKKMWKIDIFKGVEKQTEEVDLPEDNKTVPRIEPAGPPKTAA